MSDLTRPARPIYRNISITQIAGYRLPLAGIISILHRISGALLFLLLPFVLYLFDKSLTSEISFGILKSVTAGWFAKLVILALAWAYLQHFCAGIRHLFMDLHIGLEKEGGKQSAAAAIAVSLIFWVAVVLKIFGAF